MVEKRNKDGSPLLWLGVLVVVVAWYLATSFSKRNLGQSRQSSPHERNETLFPLIGFFGSLVGVGVLAAEGLFVTFGWA